MARKQPSYQCLEFGATFDKFIQSKGEENTNTPQLRPVKQKARKNNTRTIQTKWFRNSQAGMKANCIQKQSFIQDLPDKQAAVCNPMCVNNTQATEVNSMLLLSTSTDKPNATLATLAASKNTSQSSTDVNNQCNLKTANVCLIGSNSLHTSLIEGSRVDPNSAEDIYNVNNATNATLVSTNISQNQCNLKASDVYFAGLNRLHTSSIEGSRVDQNSAEDICEVKNRTNGDLFNLCDQKSTVLSSDNIKLTPTSYYFKTTPNLNTINVNLIDTARVTNEMVPNVNFSNYGDKFNSVPSHLPTSHQIQHCEQLKNQEQQYTQQNEENSCNSMQDEKFEHKKKKKIQKASDKLLDSIPAKSDTSAQIDPDNYLDICKKCLGFCNLKKKIEENTKDIKTLQKLVLSGMKKIDKLYEDYEEVNKVTQKVKKVKTMVTSNNDEQADFNKAFQERIASQEEKMDQVMNMLYGTMKIVHNLQLRPPVVQNTVPSGEIPGRNISIDQTPPVTFEILNNAGIIFNESNEYHPGWYIKVFENFTASSKITSEYKAVLFKGQIKVKSAQIWIEKMSSVTKYEEIREEFLKKFWSCGKQKAAIKYFRFKELIEGSGEDVLYLFEKWYATLCECEKLSTEELIRILARKLPAEFKYQVKWTEVKKPADIMDQIREIGEFIWRDCIFVLQAEITHYGDNKTNVENYKSENGAKEIIWEPLEEEWQLKNLELSRGMNKEPKMSSITTDQFPASNIQIDFDKFEIIGDSLACFIARMLNQGESLRNSPYLRDQIPAQKLCSRIKEANFKKRKAILCMGQYELNYSNKSLNTIKFELENIIQALKEKNFEQIFVLCPLIKPNGMVNTYRYQKFIGMFWKLRKFKEVHIWLSPAQVTLEKHPENENWFQLGPDHNILPNMDMFYWSEQQKRHYLSSNMKNIVLKQLNQEYEQYFVHRQLKNIEKNKSTSGKQKEAEIHPILCDTGAKLTPTAENTVNIQQPDTETKSTIISSNTARSQKLDTGAKPTSTPKSIAKTQQPNNGAKSITISKNATKPQKPSIWMKPTPSVKNADNFQQQYYQTSTPVTGSLATHGFKGQVAQDSLLRMNPSSLFRSPSGTCDPVTQ